MVNEMLRKLFELRGLQLPPNINNEDRLVDDLGLDSLDLIDLWLDLEDHYKIDIPEAEVKLVKTVGDIYGLLEKYKQ